MEMTVRLQVSTCKSQQVGSREPHQMSVRGSGFTGFWVSPRRTAPCSAIAQLGAFSNSAPSFPYEMGIIMIRPVQMGCFKNKWINKCKVLGTLVWHIEVKKKISHETVVVLLRDGYLLHTKGGGTLEWWPVMPFVSPPCLQSCVLET